MASLRTKFRVAWDGGEPVEILTTVKDLINAVDSVDPESANNRVALQTMLIYSALVRSPLHHPPPYDEWIDLLDEYGEVVPEGEAAGGEGPTRPAASPTGPSPSPASPEPTGEPGWDPTLPSLMTAAP